MYPAMDFLAKGQAVSMPARDGETLIVKGDPCWHTLQIRSGIARAVTYSREGDRQIMAFFFQGDLIGLPLSEVHRYTVEAVSGLQFVTHVSEQFRIGFPAHDAAPNGVSQAVWREEEAFIERGLILGRGGVQARVAAFILYLSRRLSTTNGMLKFAIPQGDLASYLATSPETVCRTLRKLRDERTIAMPRKGRLLILDENRLNFIADGGQPGEAKIFRRACRS